MGLVWDYCDFKWNFCEIQWDLYNGIHNQFDMIWVCLKMGYTRYTPKQSFKWENENKPLDFEDF